MSTLGIPIALVVVEDLRKYSVLGARMRRYHWLTDFYDKAFEPPAM